MSTVTLKGLLEAGVHFGHPRKKWCPKMSKYIFQERMGIHIVDLSKTTKCLEIAYNAARQVAQNKKNSFVCWNKKTSTADYRKRSKKMWYALC